MSSDRFTQGEVGGLRYQVGRGRSHAWETVSDDGERWKRCTHGCGVQIQSFAEFKAATDIRMGASTQAREWRVKIGSQIYWSDTVPRCGGGTWKNAQLAAGEVEERPGIEAGE